MIVGTSFWTRKIVVIVETSSWNDEDCHDCWNKFSRFKKIVMIVVKNSLEHVKIVMIVGTSFWARKIVVIVETSSWNNKDCNDCWNKIQGSKRLWWLSFQNEKLSVQNEIEIEIEIDLKKKSKSESKSSFKTRSQSKWNSTCKIVAEFVKIQRNNARTALQRLPTAGQKLLLFVGLSRFHFQFWQLTALLLFFLSAASKCVWTKWWKNSS